MKVTTSQRTFAGANICGNPEMNKGAVRHDMKIIVAIAHVIGLQEFEWKPYWKLVFAWLSIKWGSFPAARLGLTHPVQGAQGLLWRKRLYKQVQTYLHPLFDFKLPHAGISDDRWIRAVLLEDIVTKLRCWYASTHFIVHGDDAKPGSERYKLMQQCLVALEDLIIFLQSTGEAFVIEFDGNIHQGTWAYRELMHIFEIHHCITHGDLGVEFLVTGAGDKTNVVVDRVFTIPTSRLKTDHEVRCINHHLESYT